MKQLVVKITKNKFLWIGVCFLLTIWLVTIFTSEKKRSQELITYQVKRQDLLISVVEGGNLQALRSQKIINEVPGQRSILEVVEEGIQITEEDVKNGKILVKLDSKNLEDRVEQLEINVEASWSAYMEAQQNLEIQKKQNESDIKQGELKVKFARMDFEKYVGKTLAAELIEKNNFKFSELIKSLELEGETLNKKREHENSIDLAREEVARAKDRVEWSERLAEKGYVTKSELEADRLSLKQKVVSIEKAKLENLVFLNYDFPKQVEKLVSDYQESLNELERTKAKCQSRLIKGESNVKGKKATHLRYKNSLEEEKEQIAKCTIRAIHPGFVVYATSGRPWRTQDPIQPGTTVRQRQGLLNLPDFSSMGVEVKIHESSVEKVKPGQKVVIQVDTFPDKTFTGKVKTVALMPDATLKWMNPDINVYLTLISLDESYDFLKPGMSAQVEIIAKKLENVLAIPLVAISFNEGKPICAVLKGRKIETRDIELGESNEDMVEVKEGLKEGELVAISSGKITYQVKKRPRVEKGRFLEKQETQPQPVSETQKKPGVGEEKVETESEQESSYPMGKKRRRGRKRDEVPQGSRSGRRESLNGKRRFEIESDEESK